MGEGKCDMSSATDRVANLAKMEELEKRGIDLLLADSSGSMKDGYTKTEACINKNLHDIVAKVH